MNLLMTGAGITTPRKRLAAVGVSVARQFRRGLNWTSRHDYVMAALVLTVFLLFFFSWPLLHLNTHYFSAADLSQGLTLLRVEPYHTPGNSLLSDTYQNMQPWMFFNRAMLSNGQLPLWNPYNANGLPHLANYQSAVFSPFGLVNYVFDIKTALLVAPFLILFLHGFFTYLFLRQLKLRHWPALIGALAYMYSGYLILWLDWQTQAVSSLSLPVGLYCVERIFARLDTHQSAPVFWSLAGLTATLATGLLGGHPESFFAGFVLLAFFVAYRLIGLLFDSKFSLAMARRVGMLCLQIGIAGILALGIATIQLLPFLEYLANSGVISHRTPGHQSLELLSFLFFPNLLGTISGRHRAGLSLPFLNYNEANSFYIGSLVLLMALLSLVLARRSRHVRFFGIVAVVWFVYFFDLFGIGEALRRLPGLSLLPPIRSHIIWLFSVACCAAFFLDHLFAPAVEKYHMRRWSPIALPAVAATLLAGELLLANQLFVRLAGELTKDATLFFRAVTLHLLGIGVTYCAGVLVMTMLCSSRRSRLHPFAGAALLLLTFWQGGYQFKTHNPITLNELYYPVSPAIRDIQHYAGNANVAIPGANTIPAQANMAFGISLPTSYDAMWVAQYDRLFNTLFSVPKAPFGSPRIIYTMSPLGLKLFGIDYIAAVNPWQNTTIPTADLEQLVSTPDYSLYRYTGGMSRYYTVDHMQLAHTDDEAWQMVFDPVFDPARVVVIQNTAPPAAPQAESPAPPPVQVIAEQAMTVKLKVTRATSGYLVLAKTFYPGWKATVNGIAQPVLRANYAFSAIHLDAGDSEIVYYYDPDSVRYGLLISGGSLTLGLVLIAVWIISRRRRAVLPSTSLGGRDMTSAAWYNL